MIKLDGVAAFQALADLLRGTVGDGATWTADEPAFEGLRAAMAESSPRASKRDGGFRGPGGEAEGGGGDLRRPGPSHQYSSPAVCVEFHSE